MRIGFVGLGNMGTPMAAHVAAAGFDLVGYDVAGTEGRLPEGTTAAESMEVIARSADTVLMSVPDGSASLSVAEQLGRVDDSRVSVVIDLSTIGPEAARRCAEVLNPRGITYADGPVSGGVAGANARTIALMFAGPPAVFDDHRGLLDSFAGSVFHVGEHAGQGQVMKLVNNFLSFGIVAPVSEAVAMGVKAGLSLETILGVSGGTGTNNYMMHKYLPQKAFAGDFALGFKATLARKDCRLALGLAQAVGVEMPVGRAVFSVLEDTARAYPDEDFCALVRTREEQAGITLRLAKPGH